MFNINIVDYDDPFESYYNILEKYVSLINTMPDDPNSVMGTSANIIPQTLYLKHELLAKFRLFKWMYQNKYIDCKSFEELDIPPKLVNIQKDYVAMTRHIHSIDYIWDNMIFQHLINDIQYFASIHLISDETKEEIKKEIQKYKIEENIKKAVELSKAKNEAQNRYLRIKGTQIRDYQKMMSYIVFYNPTKKLNLEKLPKDKYKQSELWKYGISGDLPIILVKIKDSNDAHVIKEVLKAYEFFRTKNLETELIILDEEKHSYENYVREDVENIIQNNQIAYLKNIRAGIFELSKNEISKEDLNLLNFVATIIIDANKGGIKNALKELEEEYLEKYKDVGKEQQITLI